MPNCVCDKKCNILNPVVFQFKSFFWWNFDWPMDDTTIHYFPNQKCYLLYNCKTIPDCAKWLLLILHNLINYNMIYYDVPIWAYMITTSNFTDIFFSLNNDKYNYLYICSSVTSEHPPKTRNHNVFETNHFSSRSTVH